MTNTTNSAVCEAVAVAALDRRLASLRLASPAEVARLRRSIEREGVRHPVVVSTTIAPERLVLVDGHKRVRILCDLHIDTVLATKLALSEPAALVAMMQCNAPHRGLCDVEQAWIVRALCRTHGLKQAAVAQLLGRDPSWVCRRLVLAEKLEPSIVDDIRLGLLPSSIGRELARLPRGEQLGTEDAIHHHGLTSRQSATLVSLLMEATEPAERRSLLGDPLSHVSPARAPGTSAADSRLGPGGRRLRAAVLSFVDSSQRLHSAVSRHAPVGLGATERQALAPLVAYALDAGRSALTELDRLTTDGQPPNGRDSGQPDS